MVFSASFKYHSDLTNFINEKKILPKDIIQIIYDIELKNYIIFYYKNNNLFEKR